LESHSELIPKNRKPAGTCGKEHGTVNTILYEKGYLNCTTVGKMEERPKRTLL
jgi:hypothetical protein